MPAPLRTPPQRVDHVEEGPRHGNYVKEPPQRAQTAMLRRALNAKTMLGTILNMVFQAGGIPQHGPHVEEGS